MSTRRVLVRGHFMSLSPPTLVPRSFAGESPLLLRPPRPPPLFSSLPFTVAFFFLFFFIIITVAKALWSRCCRQAGAVRLEESIIITVIIIIIDFYKFTASFESQGLHYYTIMDTSTVAFPLPVSQKTCRSLSSLRRPLSFIALSPPPRRVLSFAGRYGVTSNL